MRNDDLTHNHLLTPYLGDNDDTLTMLIATKTYTRYAIILSLLFLFALFLHLCWVSDDNHERLRTFKARLHDRLAPHLTETRYVRSANASTATEAGLLEYAKTRLTQPRPQDDLFELGMRMRAVKGYLEAHPTAKECPFAPYKHDRNASEFGSVYEMLEGEVFGWAVGRRWKSLFELRASFKEGPCLVIPTGNAYFKYAVHIIKTVRQVFQSQIPIYVYYLGKQDLSADKIAHLRDKLAVTAIDILDIFDNRQLKMRGWDIKPFAMLAAPHDQVMLMDADSVLMQSPERFFADPGYQKEGALFFHDRTLFPTDHHKQDWLKGMLAKPLSEKVLHSRYYQMMTTYEQEAGVVLIDKRRHFGAMLAVCRLNAPPERDSIIHQETHGDKETFWMGFEMVGATYSFMPHMPGSIGKIQPDYETQKPAICGKLAHFDRNGTLMWFNDSIADNKKDKEWSDTVSELTHYGREGTWTPYLCLHSNKEPLSEEQSRLLQKLQKLYSADPLRT